ncbi:putative mitochondrial protein, conserved [Ascosphaera aggregata]|nr:putative mitochondrial protein, conserved [Ascosphaera aggregata]
MTTSFFGPRAAPVEIEDPKELAIFKKLISRSTGSFSTSIDERAKGFTDGVRRGKKKMMMMEEEEKEEKELIHPDAPKLAEPEFEGDRNPVTGEVGGPKVEPLKWGGEGEWTYNGRATDF